MTTERKPLHEEIVNGLLTLAAMVEENPELADRLEHALQFAGINAHLSPVNRAEQQAHFARVALKHGGKVTKEIDERWHNLLIDLGGVKVKVLAYRDEVCERVVTGVEKVTKTVPDPALVAQVPEVEVVEEVEIVEWRCSPLLAQASAPALPSSSDSTAVVE